MPPAERAAGALMYWLPSHTWLRVNPGCVSVLLLHHVRPLNTKHKDVQKIGTVFVRESEAV